MQKVLEDLFFGEIRCHQRFEEDESYREASLRAEESLEMLKNSGDDEISAAAQRLESSYSEMNAATAVGCYADGFSCAARLLTALLYQKE